jgi:hypothetical protein
MLSQIANFLMFLALLLIFTTCRIMSHAVTYSAVSVAYLLISAPQFYELVKIRNPNKLFLVALVYGVCILMLDLVCGNQTGLVSCSVFYQIMAQNVQQ